MSFPSRLSQRGAALTALLLLPLVGGGCTTPAADGDRVTLAAGADREEPVTAASQLRTAGNGGKAGEAGEAGKAEQGAAQGAISLASRHNKLIDEAAAALDIVADKIVAAGDDKAKLATLNEELKALQQKLGKAHFAITREMTAAQRVVAKAYSAAKLAPIAKRLREHAAVLQANHDLKAGKLPKRAPAPPAAPASPAPKRP